MFKLALTGIMAAVAITGLSSGGFAAETADHNKKCEAVFVNNQAKIGV